MGNHFGVGFRLKAHTSGRELFAQGPVVFDDPVLNNRNPATAITVGVGVVLLRLAMGRPAGMADPAKPWCTFAVHTNAEVVQLSFGRRQCKSLPCNVAMPAES